MNFLSRILNRIVFITAEFAPDGSHRTEAWLWHRHELTATEPGAARKHLAALVVCGHGVVTKPDNADVTARVRADETTFLWSAANGNTSFVRRERAASLTDKLSAEDIVPIRIFCAGSATEFGMLADAFAGQILDSLRWRQLIRPAATSSAAAQALVRRTGPLVLGAFLLLLAANAALFPQLNARRQTLQAEVAAREKRLSNTVSDNALEQELLTEFGTRPVVPHSVVCDRIAGTVPERVVLTKLQIEPLIKRFEAGKPLQRREKSIVISGQALSAADVSAFVQRLAQLTCCHDVRLANVEKQRDTDRLLFRIETAL